MGDALKAVRFVHLLLKSNVRYNLQRLIGDNEGHEIITVKNGFLDLDLEPLSDDKVWTWLNKAEAVFIHFLDEEKADIIQKLPADKKIVWFCWGADAYYLGKFDNQFLLPKTRSIRWKLGFKNFKGFKDIFKWVLGPAFDSLPRNQKVIRAIDRMDIIVPVVDADYDNLSKAYHIKAEPYRVNYINKAFILRPDIPDPTQQKNILIGNSASFSNNHIEIIDRVAESYLDGKKVYFPLSYGNMDYADYIKKYALNKLGEHAEILSTYIPFEDYMEIQASCAQVIMNHLRQQALGNIILAMWLHSSIFLHSSSGTYQHFVSKGFHILKSEDFKGGMVLTEDQKAENKQKLIEWHGPDYLRPRFTQLLKQIDEL